MGRHAILRADPRERLAAVVIAMTFGAIGTRATLRRAARRRARRMALQASGHSREKNIRIRGGSVRRFRDTIGN